MRSYLFETEPIPSKEEAPSIISDNSDDYDFSRLDGVAKGEYYDSKTPLTTPIKKSNTIVGKISYAVKCITWSLWRKILGMTKLQRIIAIAVTVVIAVVLGFTLGYLTPDDEDVPGVSSYNEHLKHMSDSSEVNANYVQVQQVNVEHKDMDTVVQDIIATTGEDVYDKYDDAPVAEKQFHQTGLLGNIIGGLFGHKDHDIISFEMLNELEEMSLINNVAYCVPHPGIVAPFNCTRACDFFTSFELVKEFSSDTQRSSCSGYVALDHYHHRIIISFRGTHSVADIVTDLVYLQDSYVPYHVGGTRKPTCNNCNVHRGFLRSYIETQEQIRDIVAELIGKYPDYGVLVTGHSLGGAIATLVGVEMALMDVPNLKVVTLGAPRVGNSNFADFFDLLFSFPANSAVRVTHKNDPVVRVPLGPEWRHTSGEIYISKGPLSPSSDDCYVCVGQEDSDCSAGEGLIYPNELIRAHLEYFTIVGRCSMEV
ncbi:Alpha/Beta hydrolase protein [Dipodascopsis uninucleata]